MNAARSSALFLTPLVLWSTLANADLGKVAEYLNKGSQKPVVVVKDGALIAPQAESKGVPGHYIEDCRKGAIRQAILDGSAKADAAVELSRKGSHRMLILARQTDADKDLGALVGVRLVANGTVQEMTFSYIMEDPANGTCSIVAVNPPAAGMISRKNQEKKVQSEVLPQLSPERLNFFRNKYGKDGKPATDEQVAKKSVKGLIELECEQYSINEAVKLARQAFLAKNPGVQSIVLLDYANSSVTSEATYQNRDAEVKKMKGFWALRLSDITATKTMSAKVSFDVNENEDSCTGAVNPQVEVGP